MKQTLFFLFLSSSMCFGQIIYNSSPAVGTEVRTKLLDYTQYTKADREKTGANQSWVFTKGELPGEPEEILIYDDPKKTFFSSQFPEANLASYYLPNLDSSINYYFKDQTGLFDLGNADPASTSKWNSKFRIYQYPIKFGEDYSDTVTANLNVDLFDIKLNMDRHTVVDGWGTVQTPIGSFPCLKLVSKSFGEGFLGPIPVLSLTSEIYQWVTPKYQTPVVAFEANEIELNNELYNDTAVYYITNSITSTENFQDIKIKVLSNPAKESINLELGKDLTGVANISLLSQDGKVVYNSNQNLDTQYCTIPCKGITPGLYLILIQAEQRRWAIEKIIIE